ncbi:Rieske 2Fe-2S domain-containing protein [Paenibacillus shunpengii]|uniref:Rieske 2Fe-2S domain-containing protein n=1 Tax=Paenibacillus shunpengii TaxID=2054424 RepID=A0ABW5SQ54_9BACL|nr:MULTISPECIES: Rieske 2Fe-2S domain-containing protein [unclassified Paenibacillus]OMC67250.1 nitrite reductase [Paenibacillus sp. FSL H7-0326]SDW67861.1 nitrite reductase (NADH) small subunit [Paenibacillus sp. PDC88]
MSHKYLVAYESDIDVLGTRVVMIENTEVALFKLSDGTIKALENRCPHKGGKLSEGMVCGSNVHCPLHDWKVHLCSGEVQAPDEGKVDAYALEIDPASGAVYVTL